jgi:hypothetical protein
MAYSKIRGSSHRQNGLPQKAWIFTPAKTSGRNVPENIAMLKSGQIESRSIITTASDAGRRRIATNLTLRPQRANSTAAGESLSLSDGRGKIIRFYPHAVASQRQPTLPMWEGKGEDNVIPFPHAASAEHVKNRSIRGDDDYDHRMLVNALAAAVLVVLVVSGEWVFSTLATIH